MKAAGTAAVFLSKPNRIQDFGSKISPIKNRDMKKLDGQISIHFVQCFYDITKCLAGDLYRNLVVLFFDILDFYAAFFWPKS